MIETPTQKTGGSAGKWIGYSTMAASFLAVGQKADAQVLSFDVEPDSVITNGVFEVNFDGDTIVDVVILHSASNASIVAELVPAGNAIMGSISGAYLYPQVLAAGAPIGPAQTNFASQAGTLALAYEGANLYGNWDGQSGYMGCRFVAGDGLVHYGWVQIAVAPLSVSATVLAYGYETTPGVGINAGDVGGPIGIAEVGVEAFKAMITPNPVSDRALIELDTKDNGPVRIALLTSTGEKLMAMEESGNARHELDMSPYAAGVYFVRLQSGKQVIFKKVVKQ